MREAGGDLDLAEEPLRSKNSAQLGAENLDGDLAVCLRSRAR
jgi:hypothetical protein